MRIDKEKYSLSEIAARIVSARKSFTAGVAPNLDYVQSSYIFSVLESAVSFQPLIPEMEKRGLISQAVVTAAKNEELDDKTLLRSLEQVEVAYLKKPLRSYTLLSSLAILPRGVVMQNRRIRGASIRFNPRLQKFDRSKLADDFENCDLYVPTELTHLTVTVRARTALAAYHNAIDAVDLMRGLWNYHINRRTLLGFSLGKPKPINAILPGPYHTIHFPNGKLATEVLWHEPQSLEIAWMFDLSRQVPQIEKFVAQVRARLNSIKYAKHIESALIRYTRALDFADHSLAFNRLWGVLEFLTSTIGSYDTLIRRVAFLCNEDERPFMRLVLEHLRDVRNAVVHTDSHHSEMESYLFQLKIFVERVLLFHLRNGKKFSSLGAASLFLDTALDVAVLKRQAQYASMALKRKF